jgi:hypothetical protein
MAAVWGSKWSPNTGCQGLAQGEEGVASDMVVMAARAEGSDVGGMGGGGGTGGGGNACEREIGKELSLVYYLIRLITSSLVFIVLMGLDS